MHAMPERTVGSRVQPCVLLHAQEAGRCVGAFDNQRDVNQIAEGS